MQSLAKLLAYMATAGDHFDLLAKYVFIYYKVNMQTHQLEDTLHGTYSKVLRLFVRYYLIASSE